MGTETIITDKKVKRNLVSFRLGRQTCALPIEPIVQIIPMVTITPVPKTDPSILGVIKVHGKLVPVVSLHRAFSLPDVSFHLYTPILLIEHNAHTIGLIVDDVLDVLTLPGEEIRHPIDLIPEEFAVDSIINGLINTPKGMVILLDVEHLFLPTQDLAMTEAWNMALLEEQAGTDGKEITPQNLQEPPKLEPVIEANSMAITDREKVKTSSTAPKKAHSKAKNMTKKEENVPEPVVIVPPVEEIKVPAEAVLQEASPKAKSRKRTKSK
jgi:purine-binding chemotaxis protein CheW